MVSTGGTMGPCRSRTLPGQPYTCTCYTALSGCGENPEEQTNAVPMRYQSRGRTGIRVAPDALGAMMLGSFGNLDREQGIAIVALSEEAGWKPTHLATDLVYRGPEVGDPILRRRPVPQRSAA